MKVLVTGCCGYIGSHTCVELLEVGYEVIGIDNFSNSKPEMLDKIKEITGKEIRFYRGDVLDTVLLSKIFETEHIDSVIDFAAYKAVGESVKKPIDYYINNVSTVLTLLKIMQKFSCKSLVFSSSATVYGTPKSSPIEENFETGKTNNPYGTSKYFVEEILKDLYQSDEDWHICILRYFNPIGAHKSGIIGEEPQGIPTNLLPFITKVASGQLDCLSIFGKDYDTKDGTGVRDYIHVVDVAKGHIKALEKIEKESGLFIYNLGTGKGYSVLDIVHSFENVNQMKINYQFVGRRAGDIGEYYSNPNKAQKDLGFVCENDIEQMVADAWNYETKRKKFTL